MQKHQEDAYQSWIEFLNPASLKSNLIVASLFLAAYETLRNSIIEHIRGFYTNGLGHNKSSVGSDDYEKVLSRHKSPMDASLLWLRDRRIVNASDIKLVNRLRKHRNDLAHDLPRFIGTRDADVNFGLIEEIYQLVTKIDRWWVREVEIPTNPDFDDQDVDAIADEEIVSGNMLFLQLMIHVATGDDADAKKMHDLFVQMAEQHAAQPVT